ncbi:MAG: ABC transporter permease [Anaerolineae bacterium]|nr:ABC transporter permease [Anaerolineae bacterium]
MQTARKIPSVIAQLIDLFLIEWTNWRWSWRSMVVVGAAGPVLSILGLGLFARDAGPQVLAYVLTGNMVISLMLGNMSSVENHFSFMRFQGTLDYFATLPVRRTTLILAVLVAFFLIHLPAMLITLLLGVLVLRVPLHVHPLLLLVVPLCALPLSGIGALIGTRARTPQEGGPICLLMTMVMSGLGPVIAPPERFPTWLNILGRINPAVYAASALRQTLIGPLTAHIWLDLGVLLGVSAIIFWLVGRKLDWRQR